MDIVFMGTPDFAVPVLEKLIESHNVTAVITQPDKPVGRGKKIKFPPVKEAANKYGIEVYQPKRIKDKGFMPVLFGLKADIFVIVAYGQILSKEILDIPKYGCVNVHASILPKYRGAAPIERAIINGDNKTGITIMQMNEGLDTGDILLSEEIGIDILDTGDTLRQKLSVLGSNVIVKALDLIEERRVSPTPQEDKYSSYAPMLTKDMGKINWDRPAIDIYNLIRGLNPWPCAYSELSGHGIIKIWKAYIIGAVYEGAPGTIVAANKKDGLIVSAKGSSILIEQLQAPGSKRMDAKSYMLGHEIKEGLKFN